MDTQQYSVGVGLVPSYSSTLLARPRSFTVLNNHPMAWNGDHASPPSSASSSSSSLYSALSHSSDGRVDYSSSSASMVPRHSPDSYATYHQSPNFHPTQSAHGIAFPAQQMESSIGPTRDIIQRRRARTLALTHDQSQSTASTQNYDLRRQHSLAFAVQQRSRPQTPSADIAMGIHDSIVATTSPALPYSSSYMASHSRSVSGSAPNLRSTSPALSVSSAITTLSSNSAARYSTLPQQQQESEPEELHRVPKHRKTRLWSTDRKQICIFHRENPGVKQETIASKFGVERSTISKILKEKDRWLNVQDDEKLQVSKFRPSKFPNLELALQGWLRECARTKTLITDAAIRTKAREVALQQGLTEDRFKASSGWVENFKARHGIKKGQYHGNGLLAAKERAIGRTPEQVEYAATQEMGALAGEHEHEVTPEEGVRDASLDMSAPQTTWNPSPEPAVYNSAEPVVLPQAVPVATGTAPQAFMRLPEMIYAAPQVEVVPSLADASAMMDRLLGFFTSHRDIISPEHHNVLRDIKATLFQRSQPH
ncbi:uncharacterized protein LAESUDRAFT_723096 [Laetiporus sulphureus 93-53]|uniref:HTH CENPB-type domain-containing protein n=1 Tax=Laetiporus sulphureus 93-53 TaxID=1314785 RepID=A0A165FSI8_9APHY|nr:uncharacterized protein LAESUDRAFT_723096 [Laetiporus sulphureus 93-53]KZT09356.1 hypothetical protein LAESUDRAFT_723096 [Laetiporus sulphureus 93-53]